MISSCRSAGVLLALAVLCGTQTAHAGAAGAAAAGSNDGGLRALAPAKRSVTKRFTVPASPEQCRYLKARQPPLPCLNVVTSTLTSSTAAPESGGTGLGAGRVSDPFEAGLASGGSPSGPSAGSGASADSAGSTAETSAFSWELPCLSGQEKCLYRFPPGSWLPETYCGYTYTGSWDTEVHDITGGTLWHARLHTLFSGTLCDRINWESVDCYDTGGTGYSVDVEACDRINDGGGAPLNYTEAMQRFKVSFLFKGFPISNSIAQGQQLDKYGNGAWWYE